MTLRSKEYHILQVSNAPIRTVFPLLSKTIIISFILALISATLNPLPANATSTNYTSVKEAPINLNAESTCNSNWGITVDGSAANLPPIPDGEEYRVSWFKMDTGEYFGQNALNLYNYDTRYSSGIDPQKFIPVGKSTYQLVLTHRPIGNPYYPSNVTEITNAIGKSAPFLCERKPVTVSLSTPQNDIGMNGTTLDWKLNQTTNGDAADVYIFNITTGGLAGWGHTSEGAIDKINFPFGQQFQYQAFLLAIPRYNYFSPGVTHITEISNVVAASNIVTIERKPWKIGLKESSITEGNLEIDYLAVGGGREYATYVVDNDTKEIIWDSPANMAPYNGNNIPNPQGKDLSKFTAYVAVTYAPNEDQFNWMYASWYYANYYPTAYYYPADPVNGGYLKPTKVSDLKDIIASSDGHIQAPSGVTDPKQIAGGKNPSEPCSQCSHRDPINAGTGEFYDTKTDIKTVGNGLVPEVERSFSTINKDHLNSLGYGWRSNYEMRIAVDSTKDTENTNILNSKFLNVENENGSVSSFYKNVSGSFEGAAKTQAALTWDESNQTFTYARKDKTVFIFNSVGKLTQIDRGQVVTLDYVNDKLNTVSDEVGNTLTFAYGPNGLVQTVTAQNGKVVTYSYDANKQLLGVEDAKQVSFNYTYDTEKRVKTLTNELGGVTTNTYNADSQVIEQVDPLGRSATFAYTGEPLNGTTQITYPNNKVIEETYVQGQIRKRVENFGQANPRTWQYTYDGKNNLASVLNPDFTSSSMRYDVHGNMTTSTDENGNATTFTYDSRDNLLTVTDPNGNVTSNEYDANDNLISSTSSLGAKTSFAYNADKSLASSTDARGNVSSANPSDFTSAFSYIANGLVSDITNSAGGTTSMTYDAAGNMIEAEDARGNTTTMEYNASGLLTKAIDPLHNETAMTYDKMGNVLTSKNAKNAVTTYTYDIVGNKLTSTNALNQTTTYAYNSMDQPVSITLADGTVQTITYDIFGKAVELKDQLNRITKQEWDSNGRMTASINPNDGRTEYTYDSVGNVKEVKTPKGAVTSYNYDKLNRLDKVTDALGRTATTEYDANGQIVKTTAADGTTEQKTYDAVGNVLTTKDESGNSKTYTYDALNRKTSFTNEIGQVTAYSYDANSNLISQTRPDDSVVTYAYDARNLLTSIDYQGTGEDITYTYDELGRKISEKKGSFPSVAYTYDNLNRVLTRGTSTSIVSYAYDRVGNLTSLTYPSGRVVTYGYDDAAQLTQLNTTGVGDTNFAYNNRGLLTSETLANGVIESNSYDTDNQLTSTELTKNGTSLYKRTQSYNLVGDVTQRGTGTNGAAVTLDNFVYDPLSRLTEQKADADGQPLNSYGYNTVGNLTTVGAANQEYDKAGKVTSTGTATIDYDARNNRTELLDSVDVNKNGEYQWAQNNLLTSVTTHGEATPKTVEYGYGADMLLQTRTIGSSTSNFVWDSSREIPVMLSDGNYEYVYSKERTPLAQIEIATGIVTYLHNDLTGSVTASINANGQLVGTVDFSPYGQPTGSLLSRFGYAGEWVDEVTAYSYLRARWLDTATGTFLSEDPLIQITNNAFGYTKGNPITHIDPLGLADWLTKLSQTGADAATKLSQTDAYKTFDKVNWSDVATVIGIGAAAIGVVAVLTVGAPIVGIIVATVTIASIAAATAATAQTCIDDGSWAGGSYSGDCIASNVGLGLSVLPAATAGIKPIKNMNDLATKALPVGSYEDNLAIGAKATWAKFKSVGYNNSALAEDGVVRAYISQHPDEKCN